MSASRQFHDQPAHYAHSGRWGAMAAFVMVAAPAAIYTLNHFYVVGAATDSWWHAWLIWRNSPNLENPVSIAAGRSFYGVHLSPILVLPALLSHFVPLGMFTWYAAFIGAGFGLLGAAVFDVLRRSIHGIGPVSGICTLGVAVGFGLGGFALAALQLPHYEILFVGFAALFLSAVARDDRRASWIWFLLAVAVREDAALHLFCILAVAQFLCRKSTAWPFIFASLAYAAFAFAAKQLFWPPWPAPGGLMVHNFIGSPPYAHLNVNLVLERLWTIFWWRGYIWQTALVCVLWGIWARDRLIVGGLVSVLPWLVLCVTGVAGAVTTLDQYYSFPFLLAMIWPAIAIRWRHGEAAARLRVSTLAWMLAIAAAGAFGWRAQLVCFPCSSTLRAADARIQPAQVEEFGTRLRESVSELGRTRVDMAVRALWPDAGERIGWLYPYNQLPQTQRDNDTVVWFDRGLQDSLAWAAVLGSRLSNQYRVLGTNIVVTTNRRLETSTFAPQLRRADLLWERMRPMPIARLDGEGLVVPRSAPRGLMAYGPHAWISYGINEEHGIALPPGRYEARFVVRAAQVADVTAPVVRLQVVIHGGPTLAAEDWRVGPAYATARQEVLARTVPFEIPASQGNRILLLQPIHLGNADLVLRSVTLVRTD